MIKKKSLQNYWITTMCLIFNTSYKKAESFYEIETSSNVNEVIRAVLNSFIFFTNWFCTHKKNQKHKDATKQKHKNANKRISIFFPLDVFYAHKTQPFLFWLAYVRFCAFFCVWHESSHLPFVSTYILTKRKIQGLCVQSSHPMFCQYVCVWNFS